MLSSAGATILPLLSRVPGAEGLSAEAVQRLTHRIQFGGDEVVAAKGARTAVGWTPSRFAFVPELMRCGAILAPIAPSPPPSENCDLLGSLFSLKDVAA